MKTVQKIRTAEEFINMKPHNYYELCADIDFTGVSYNSVDLHYNHLDGNNFSIKNIESKSPIFGSVCNSTIENLFIINAFISSRNKTSLFARDLSDTNTYNVIAMSCTVVWEEPCYEYLAVYDPFSMNYGEEYLLVNGYEFESIVFKNCVFPQKTECFLLDAQFKANVKNVFFVNNIIN